MEKIKKELYKQRNNAKFQFIKNGVAHYRAAVRLPNEAGDIYGVGSERHIIYFEIPVNEMGESEFKELMPARHLIRWITDTAEDLTFKKEEKSL